MIEYVIGDATRPIGEGPHMIAHVCNDVGSWGAGFVLALSRRWWEPENAYRSKFPLGAQGIKLGTVQFVVPQDGIIVANMIAQKGTSPDSAGRPPIRYVALRECLAKVAETAYGTGSSVHMPRIGCGLAGGEWRLVEPIIKDTLVAHGVPVTVYDLPGDQLWKA